MNDDTLRTTNIEQQAKTQAVNALAVLDVQMVRKAVERVAFAKENAPKMVPLCEDVARQTLEARDAFAGLIAAVRKHRDSVTLRAEKEAAQEMYAALARVGGGS